MSPLGSLISGRVSYCITLYITKLHIIINEIYMTGIICFYHTKGNEIKVFMEFVRISHVHSVCIATLNTSVFLGYI